MNEKLANIILLNHDLKAKVLNCIINCDNYKDLKNHIKYVTLDFCVNNDIPLSTEKIVRSRIMDNLKQSKLIKGE